jgi:hypothetical protein
MSALQQALTDYLALRRALGYKLVSDGQVLERFVAFVEQAGSTHITTALALQWATRSASHSPIHQARQLSRVRLCVFRRIRPPVPAESGRPFRAKSATPKWVPSRGCDFYCSRVVAVK